MPGRQSASVRSALSGKGGRCCGILVPVTDAASPLGCSGVPVPVPNTRYFASPRPMRVAIRAAGTPRYLRRCPEQFIGYANDFRGQFLAPNVAPPKDTSSSLVSVFSPSSSPSSVVPSEVAQSMSAVGGIQNLRHTGNSTVIFQCFDDLIAELGWYGVPLFHPASCPEHAAPLKRRSSALISPRPRRKTH